MSNALFSAWNRVVPGREKDAMELFQSTMAYWGKLQAAGEIDSFDPVLLAAHGGDMNGYFLIKGNPQKLDAIRHSDDFVTLQIRAGHILQGYGTVDAYHGDRLQQLMGQWGALISG